MEKSSTKILQNLHDHLFLWLSSRQGPNPTLAPDFVDFKLSCALKSNKSTVEEDVRFSSLISFQRRQKSAVGLLFQESSQ